LLLNGHVEGGFFHPAYWSQYVYPFSSRYEYELGWSQAEYQSSSHALMIKREGIGDPTPLPAGLRRSTSKRAL